MAFENLSSKLQNIFKNLKSKGRLTEKDVTAALREVRLALLEADVNFKLVKDFISNVKEKAVGEELYKSLSPGQHVIKIVHEQLVSLLGNTQSKLTFSSRPPTVFMLVGLQGAGKTTTCGKLAAQLSKEKRNPLLVACDIYRPAAVKQLQVVGKAYNVPVFTLEKATPVEIAKQALVQAEKNGNGAVIIDTAGRLHIDPELMDELVLLKTALLPQEILLTIDAMTGQEAVNVAESFNQTLGIDGVIVTKLDGDTRGGAALSVCYVTGKPIKYIGMGEKLEDLEPFHPDRMASRILGMGDVLSLIEKAQTVIDEEEALNLERKLRTQDFSLEDFLTQMEQVKKMGPLKSILEMIPGVKGSIDSVDDDVMIPVEAIIRSMTPKERQNPGILNGSRKRRIAKGSGRTVPEINRLLKQFEEMKKLMKQFNNKKGMPFFR